jgi:hypothetical protein
MWSECLPLAIEGEHGADFEVPRRNIERLGDAGPLFEIAESRPARDAVVDDEEASAFRVSGHRNLLRTSVALTDLGVPLSLGKIGNPASIHD